MSIHWSRFVDPNLRIFVNSQRHQYWIFLSKSDYTFVGVQRASAIWLVWLAQIGYLSPVTLVIALFFVHDNHAIRLLFAVWRVLKINPLTADVTFLVNIIPLNGDTGFLACFTPIDAVWLSLEYLLIFRLNIIWCWERDVGVHAVLILSEEHGILNLIPWVNSWSVLFSNWVTFILYGLHSLELCQVGNVLIVRGLIGSRFVISTRDLKWWTIADQISLLGSLKDCFHNTTLEHLDLAWWSIVLVLAISCWWENVLVIRISLSSVLLQGNIPFTAIAFRLIVVSCEKEVFFSWAIAYITWPRFLINSEYTIIRCHIFLDQLFLIAWFT